MPRFVILEHDHPFLHWDLMLEEEAHLRTWRLLEQPTTGRTIAAEALATHRKDYLDYEGPVRGNRGRVVRWDVGTFVWQEDSATRVVVQVWGRRYQGTLVLEQEADTRWRLGLPGQ